MAYWCRYWRLTPTEFYALEDLERAAMWEVMEEEARAHKRAASKARK